MRITVLAENPIRKTSSPGLKSEHGLSLFIEFDGRKILFDTGQSDLFIRNAEKLKIDLSEIDYLAISNGHLDNGGGLSRFLKINKKAKIFMHIKAANQFYTRIFGFIPYYVGFDQKTIKNSRIYFIEEDTQIEDKIILLEGFPEGFPQPEANKSLFEKTKTRFITDRFNHEIAMLLIEDDEVVLFSGCSHSGIINIIEEVKIYSKNMRIKAAFGGLNINNPIGNKSESQEYTDRIIKALVDADHVFYTGRCTGEINFRYIKGIMSGKIITMNTGDVVVV